MNAIGSGNGEGQHHAVQVVVMVRGDDVGPVGGQVLETLHGQVETAARRVPEPGAQRPVEGGWRRGAAPRSARVESTLEPDMVVRVIARTSDPRLIRPARGSGGNERRRHCVARASSRTGDAGRPRPRNRGTIPAPARGQPRWRPVPGWRWAPAGGRDAGRCCTDGQSRDRRASGCPRSFRTAYWTVGSACSGISRRRRFQKTAAMRARSSFTTASRSTMEAKVRS